MARTEREAFGARLRFEVLRRCNFACFYCGVPAAYGMKQLHVDHVVPVSLGGTNEPWNLVAACWDCNAGKTNGVPTRELIERVRNNYCAYMESLGYEIVSCRFCALPIQIAEGDDIATQCELCDAIVFYGYDAGSGEPREWVRP
jgi:hypothetical protein